MTPLRVACVQYLNAVPLIEGLEKLREVELIPCVPAAIAGLIASGGADVGLASLVDAACAPTPLALLPVGMIGCDGPTLTVRLFSAVPFERVRVLDADRESRTSVVLCRLLLDRLFGVRPEVRGLDTAGLERVRRPEPPETLLLIGDKVVTSAPDARRYPHQLDLGAAWHGLTGLPFMYAVWACRAEEADSPRIRMIAATLDRQRRRNAARLGWIVARRAAAHGWPFEMADRYLGSLLRYEVGAREMAAAGRFLDQAAELGFIPRVTPNWVMSRGMAVALDSHASFGHGSFGNMAVPSHSHGTPSSHGHAAPSAEPGRVPRA